MGPASGISSVEWKFLAGIVVVAFIVRMWKIGQPSSVVFDEVHFGGFASKYIKQHFFMDVHPPLAKLMIAFVAWINGFHGNFDFKDISKEYLVGEGTPVPYVAMRSMNAILGVATVPLAYLTLRALSLRATSAMVGALLVTFDNALATQSRLILLDSPLVFFTAWTTYAWVSFCNEERRRAFTSTWWSWLALTGFGLGCVVSVKWVGLFTIATVGVCVLVQLWSHLGDVRQPLSTIIRHFFARFLCLIIIPFSVYLWCFAVHLAVLNRSGDGDGFMSSAFQHTLKGHGMRDTYADVALGSTVTIRHLNTQGGYLHSHPHNYPTGSGQQQITLYPHVDENNEWIIVKAPGADDPPPPTDKDGVPLPVAGPHEAEKHWNATLDYLQHGTEIRFVHRKTNKRLHSHDHRPPITEADYQNEVSAYGFVDEEGRTFAGDSNDHWIVEIERGDSSDSQSTKRVRALRSVVRFRHTLTGAYLFSHKIPLPDWGYGQQEVSANKAVGAPRAPRKK
ncbi:PMT-domain-containing protein [Acaromyces ingoldii]|uniref:dolichyl-phosphate-mannose--protein mannosyltransferase n=1 Tax=Acaromyces ingoldii TaxID=215250 RepID=A0A316YYK8_9BASI|nr:PMT-domain-containing protein [Acaromyces ingoldii]PWN92925.1 PMT-domain-containing protein [Acaromyces ingoldii]